jgi:hypothetical protein
MMCFKQVTPLLQRNLGNRSGARHDLPKRVTR